MKYIHPKNILAIFGPDYLARVGIQIMSILGIIVLVTDEYRLAATHMTELIIVGVLLFLTIVVVPYFVPNNDQRRLYVLAATNIGWFIFIALVLPFDTPFLIVNYLLIYLALEHPNKLFVYCSAFLAVAASEISIIRADAHPPDRVWLPIFVSFSIILMAWLGVKIVQKFASQQQAQIEEEIESKLQQERLHSLINSMRDAVIATDEKGVIVEYNAATLDLIDSNITLVQTPLKEAINFIDQNKQPIDILEITRAQKHYLTSRDYSLQISGDDIINLYVSVAPVRISYGRKGQSGYILVLRDITHEKSLEEERDEFISVVSHELRTPITVAEASISNAQLLLSKGADPGKLNSTLEDAHNQVNFLASMINDLSTLSRAEKETLDMEVETIKPTELITQLYNEYKEQAEKKSLQLKLNTPDSTPEIITSPLYLKEILQNFITNAIKYTKEGTVTLSLVSEKKGVTFSVADTGIGISTADKSKIFDKFFRSEDFRTRENNGTGLGLYVTLKLIKRINAKVDFESELNKGSKFSLTLPQVAARDEDQKLVSKEQTEQFVNDI